MIWKLSPPVISSLSGTNGACVRASVLWQDADGVHVDPTAEHAAKAIPRNKIDEKILIVVDDSQNPGNYNYYTVKEWAKFIDGVNKGEFNLKTLLHAAGAPTSDLS